MMNAVYCFEDSSILICENPDFKWRLIHFNLWKIQSSSLGMKNDQHLPKLSRSSWILGSGIWVLFCAGIETSKVYTKT